MSVLVWVIGVCGAIIITLLTIIGYFGKRTICGLEDSIRTMAKSLSKFSDDISAEVGDIHKRQDRLESAHSELRGVDHKLTDVGTLKLKVAATIGWQKAQAFFIVLCFATVVTYAGSTNASVAKVQESVSKIDKQVATMIAADSAFKKQTRKDITALCSRVLRLENKK